jgi:large repetitive protein
MGTLSVRASGALLATAAVVVSTLGVVDAPRSGALSPGLSFTADSLPTWQTDGVVWALGQTAGTVVAGGDFTRLRPPAGRSGASVATTALAFLDAETGEPDDCQLSISYDEPGFEPTVRAIAADDAGVVWVGGDFSRVGDVDVSRLAAVDVTTCEVLPFRAEPLTGPVHALALDGDVLYVGGEFDQVRGTARANFAAVDATTGDLRPWAPETDGTGYAIGVSPDGSRVAVGGDFSTVGGAASRALAVVDAEDGDVVRAYSGGFIPQSSLVTTIDAGGDSGRFYVGNEGTGKGAYDGRLAIDWESLSQVWRDTCNGATQSVVTYAGTLYSASHAHRCEAVAYQAGKRNFFNAQDAATGALIGWDPRGNDGIGEGIGPRALTVAVGDVSGTPYLWAGGEFTEINGAPQQGLARFGTDDVGAPPRPVAYAQASDDGTIQVRWRAVVDPDDSRLTYSVYRGRSKRPVWTGTADSVWWKVPQLTFVDRKVTKGKTYAYRVQASDGTTRSARSTVTKARAVRRSSTYETTVKADRPTLYWTSQKTDGNSPWVQEVGAVGTGTRRLDGQVQGAALPVSASPLGRDSSGSIQYDGKNDYLWNDEYTPGPQAYSLEVWFRTRTRKGGSLIGYGNGRPKTNSGNRVASSPGRIDRVVYLTNRGQLRFGVNPGRPVVAKSARKVNDGKWHHVVATQDRRGMRLYLDGKRVAKASATRSGTSYGVWHVGGDSLAGYPQKPRTGLFAGLIDEVAVYPEALPQKRVVAHFRAARREHR